MLSNDIKFKYMFMVPLQNLACKGLTTAFSQNIVISNSKKG